MSKLIKYTDFEPMREENAKLKEQNKYLLENLKRLVDRLEENDFGHMSAVIRAKEAIKKAEQ